MRNFYFKIKKDKSSSRSGWTIDKRYEAIEVDSDRDRVMFIDDNNEFSYIELRLCIFDSFVEDNYEPIEREEVINENEEEKRKELLKLIRSEITKRQNEFIKEYNIRKE